MHSAHAQEHCTIYSGHNSHRKKEGMGMGDSEENGVVRNIGEDIISLLWRLVVEHPSNMDKAQAGFKFPITTHT